MNTEQTKQLQSALGVQQDGDLGPKTRKAFADKLIAVALSQVGLFETSKNHGDGIAKFWKATSYAEGYANREPYCAAAVCWMVRETGVFSEQDRPKTAAAFGFEAWGRSIGLNAVKAPSSVKRGDLVIFEFSHVGIATSDSDRNGYFETVEANTSSGAAGSQRDGGGIYKRRRNIDSLRSVVRL